VLKTQVLAREAVGFFQGCALTGIEVRWACCLSCVSPSLQLRVVGSQKERAVFLAFSIKAAFLVPNLVVGGRGALGAGAWFCNRGGGESHPSGGSGFGPTA
jgi:hypothetical protein